MGTAFDFRKEKSVVADIESGERQIAFGMGYDHNFVLNGTGLRKAALLRHHTTGICMEVLTTAPGLQLYTDNDRSPAAGKDGAVYDGRKGICLETQSFPNSPNQVHFPSVVLRHADAYTSKTLYRFSIK
jgi:aldose 1-epimerase